MNSGNRSILLALILLLLIVNMSRLVPVADEPALLSGGSGKWVQLGHGFAREGEVRQIDDAWRLSDVIILAGCRVAADRVDQLHLEQAVLNGQRIDLVLQGAEIQRISLSWMTAGQRVALNIPLHPDRMSQSDWEFLPGVGPQTAARIIVNRQKNGDFGSFDALTRIKGIGQHKMQVWKEYF